MLLDNHPYVDPGNDHNKLQADSNAARWLRKLEEHSNRQSIRSGANTTAA